MARPSPSWLLSPFVSALLVLAPAAQEPVDADTVAFLREHGLENGQAMELLSWMCDVYGPRLTGSPNLRHAQDWAKKTFEDWGLSNVHFEKWGPFGRGWQLESFHADVVGDNPWPVLAWPKAWSATLGDVEGELVLASTLDPAAIADMDLSDKIVLVEDPRTVEEPFDPLAERRDSDDLLPARDRRARAPGERGSAATAATLARGLAAAPRDPAGAAAEAPAGTARPRFEGRLRHRVRAGRLGDDLQR